MDSFRTLILPKKLNEYLICSLELSTSQPKEDSTKFVSSMCDDHFAFEFINELAKAFLRAEDRTAQVSTALISTDLST
jgi:hypothetical protein